MDESRFGCTMSCDEFVRFWQDKKLRTFIYQKAWLLGHGREDAEDMRQEAWAAICALPPESTDAMAHRAAYNAMMKFYMRDRYRQKKVQIVPLSS